MIPIAHAALPTLISSAHWVRAGNASSTLHRSAISGRLVRIHSGVYAEASEWAGASPAARYRSRIAAVDLRARDRPVFSHESAAALHGLPGFRVDTGAVHLTVIGRAHGRVGPQLARHSAPLSESDIVEIDGLRCTSLARTAADLALTRPFASAVVALDHVLHDDSELREAIGRSLFARPSARIVRRATQSLRFSDGLSDGPLESVSRAHMFVLGFPPPVLQHSFVDAFGLIGRVDFWWPEFEVVGEADGLVKYTDPAMLGGRSSAEVVVIEKRREDRIRALVRRFGRWDWRTASDLARFERCLTGLGLPRRLTN